MSGDIFAAIDAATGCQWCEGPLGSSPSGDYCGPECQQAWHTARATPLTAYREAGHDFGNDAVRWSPDGGTREGFVGGNRGASVQIVADANRALSRSLLHATQGVAEAMRPVTAELVQGLRAFGPLALAIIERPDGGAYVLNSDGTTATEHPLLRTRQAFTRAAGQVVQHNQIRTHRGSPTTIVAEDEASPLLNRDETPQDPMQRALELRRNRNTGPVVPPPGARRERRSR